MKTDRTLVVRTMRFALVALALATFPVAFSLLVPAAARFVALGGEANAAADSGVSSLVQMRQFTSSTKSARGTFAQQTLKQSGEVAESSSGKFAFARPGRFRWEVTKPFEQLLVADGQQVYFFDKDLNQVTVRKLDDALGATPAAILFGTADLEQSFNVTDTGQRDGLAWLEARPKTRDSGFEMIAIGLRDGLPQAMQVKDAFGRLTTFSFSGVERNPTVDAQAFRFVPPQGAEVVRQ